MERLDRKIDSYLASWKYSKDRFPLIIKGARQIGKTEAIKHFALKNYKSVVEKKYPFCVKGVSLVGKIVTERQK